jgi:hypothetical protein
MSRWHRKVAIGLLVVLMIGCGRPASRRAGIRLSVPPSTGETTVVPSAEEPTPPVGVPTAEALPLPLPGATVITTTPEAGAITGQLRWEGVVQPASSRLRIHTENQGIADAVVWLAEAPSTPVAAREVELYHSKPSFRPRVLLVPRGSTLKMLSTDPKGAFQAHGAATFTCTAEPRKPQSRTLDQVGHLIVRSDADPGMTAHVWVFDHNYVALTDANGHFRLPDVSPGKYRAVLWHEGWRDNGPAEVVKTVTVELGKGQGAHIEFSLTERDAERK